MKNTSTYKKYLTLGVFSFFLISFSVYAWFKLPWWDINEEQANGFLVIAGNTKTITVHSDCKKVTAVWRNVFIPTRTLTEWTQFKAHATNVGAIVSDCITYTWTWTAGSCSVSCGDGTINAPICSGWTCDPGTKPTSGWYCNNGTCPSVVTGYCGSSSNTCSNGSPSGYSAWACGGNQTWTCLGSGGGSDASCSIANAACPTNGVCGASAWTCNSGTPANGNGATACSTVSTWDCLGVNGGSNAACTYTNATCTCSNGATNYPACNNRSCNAGMGLSLYCEKLCYNGWNFHTNVPAQLNNTVPNGGFTNQTNIISTVAWAWFHPTVNSYGFNCNDGSLSLAYGGPCEYHVSTSWIDADCDNYTPPVFEGF